VNDVSGCIYLLIIYYIEIAQNTHINSPINILFYVKKNEVIYLCKRSIEYFTFVVIISTT